MDHFIVATGKLDNSKIFQTVGYVFWQEAGEARSVWCNWRLGQGGRDKFLELYPNAPRDSYIGYGGQDDNGGVGGRKVAFYLTLDDNDLLQTPTIEGQKSGIKMSVDPVNAKRLGEAEYPVKTIFGNCLWQEGALESMVGEGFFKAVPASTDVLFHTHEDALWQKLINA